MLGDSALGGLALLGKEARNQAEQPDPKMYEVEVEIETELDGAEVAEPEKTGDRQDCVDGSKDETEEACAA